MKTGRSFLLMTEAGVEVFGGSQRRGSFWTAVFWLGPSGW